MGLGICVTILRFADYPLAPLLIGFILERPMIMGLLAIAVLLVFLPSYRARRARAEGAADTG